MKKIETFDLGHITNDAFFEFFVRVIILVNRIGAAQLKIEAPFATLVALHDDADTALKKITKSPLTQKIQNLDHERDNLFRGLVEANRSALRHFDVDVQDAATILKIVLDTYGDIARKPMSDETSAIYNLTKDLEEKYPTQCAKVGINDWLTKLKQVNQEFRTMDMERNDEVSARTELVLKEVRVQMSDVYRTIVERIHAAMIMEGEIPPYTDFVTDLNTLVKKAADTLSQRQGARAATKAKAAAAEAAAAETETKIDPETDAFTKEAGAQKK